MTTRQDNSPTALLRRVAGVEWCEAQLILPNIVMFVCSLEEGHSLPHRSFDVEDDESYCIVWPTEE